MNGKRIRVTISNPCPICGSTDYDMIMDYGIDGAVVWCHHLEYSGNVLGRDGKEYVCIKEKKESQIGIFNLFKEKSIVDAERQKWVEEQKANNPDWKNKGKFTKQNVNLPNRCAVPIMPISKSVIEEHRLEPSQLDKMYRYFLSLLCLEDKHKKVMLDEWKSNVYPCIGETLLSSYPIRSMPPTDRDRYLSGEKLKNLSRKDLTQKMLERFGTVYGLPGFYIRDGEYWKEKPEEDRWTFAGVEGIIFPMIDKDGHIVGLRSRVDYPGKKIKSTDKVKYHGKSGTFFHKYGKKGQHEWYFIPDGEKEGVLAKDVPLKNNIPTLGRASGKYIPFTSFKEDKNGGNAYKLGVSSGAPYSLYYPIGGKGKRYKYVFLTEGEKKGMITSQIKNSPCASFPGVGNWKTFFEKDECGVSCFDKLKSEGAKYFIICWDADKQDNLQVSSTEKRLQEAISAHGGVPLIGEWSGKFDKGIDDILLMGIDINIRQPE